MRGIDRLAAISRRAPDVRGRAQLAWWLMRTAQAHGRLGTAWDIAMPDGSRLVLPRTASMAWRVAFEGSYDAAPRAVLNAYVEPGTVVLDVGASLGLWTVPLGRAARAAGARLWAFEPLPSNVGWLRGNVERNGLADVVTVQPVGLGDRAGVAYMDAGEALDDGGGGNASMSVEQDATDGIPVEIRRLDDVAFPARVSAIKLDVEGFEPSILRGARELLQRDRPVIFGEFEPIWMRVRDEKSQDVLAMLDELGYRAHALEPYRSRPWTPLDQVRLRPLAAGELTGDLLLIPAEAGPPRAVGR